jgi:hypothetical protein
VSRKPSSTMRGGAEDGREVSPQVEEREEVAQPPELQDRVLDGVLPARA